jgi:hypothetical protein
MKEPVKIKKKDATRIAELIRLLEQITKKYKLKPEITFTLP